MGIFVFFTDPRDTEPSGYSGTGNRDTPAVLHQDPIWERRMIQEAIARVVQRRNLSREYASLVLREIMEGRATSAQISGLLVALRMKGETVEEITGFAETMRAFATPIQTNRRPLVDTCGTGGDHAGTFNISTTAAFVVAGAGIAVAKHGNRSASSQCGSADVLEALGVNINATPAIVSRCINEIGIGFLFARSLHGAMKHVAPIRAELKTRTIFNILGPLTNPANACGQVMGVFDAALVEPLARVLAELGVRHAFVVAGHDGMDELTLAGPSHVAETQNGNVEIYDLDPVVLGLPRMSREAILGGEPTQNARILLSILDGKTGPHRDIVLLNAAAAILAGEGAEDWPTAYQRAAESVDSGAAKASIEALIRMSHDS